MPENEASTAAATTQTTNTETKTAGVIASAGKPERAGTPPFLKLSQDNVSRETEENNQSQSTAQTDTTKTDATKQDTTVKAEDKTIQQAEPPKELSDDELKKLLEGKGIKFEGNFEELKKKLSEQPIAAIELTAEQKAAKQLAEEKRVLDLFISNGGTAEQFVAIKSIANSDVTELSVSEVKAELKAAKFTDEQIAAIIKERYYQLDDDEIEQLEDETDKEFAKRKKEYGAGKLANRSLYKKQQAEQILNGLKKAIETEDSTKQNEVQFSASVDDHFKKIASEETIDLGDIENLKILPIKHTISENSINQAKAILKDRQQLNNFLFTKDGSLDIENIADLLITKYEQKEKLIDVYTEALDRNTKVWEERFPARTAQDLGVGGAPNKVNGEKGKIVSASKPQVVRRPA